MSRDKNWGASGFSVRRGGERASDDDDVEGHAMTTSQREMGASAMNRTGQRSLGRRGCRGPRPQPPGAEGSDDDDVEGHGLSRPRSGQKASDDDVEGHAADPAPRLG